MAEKGIIRPPADDEWKRQASNFINKLVGNVPTDSTAASVAELVADLNELLAMLRGLNTK